MTSPVRRFPTFNYLIGVISGLEDLVQLLLQVVHIFTSFLDHDQAFLILVDLLLFRKQTGSKYLRVY